MHSRTTNTDRRRNFGRPSSSTPEGRTREQNATWYPSSEARPPIIIPAHQHYRDEPRATPTWHSTREPAPTPFMPESHIRINEPSPIWHDLDPPLQPSMVTHHRPVSPVREPEFIRAHEPRNFQPQPQNLVGGPVPIIIPPAPSPPRHGHGHSPVTVQIPPAPPSPSHQFGQPPPPVIVSIQPDSVHHHQPPRSILRRDSATTRHRRPSGSGSAPRPPVVRVASSPPIVIQEPPLLSSGHGAPGQPAHRLPPWTWPEPPEPETSRQDFIWPAPQPPEPTWGPWQPSGSHRRTRSGRPRKGSQSSAPAPPGPHSPPPVRSPPNERRPPSSFTANDPFKVQTPRSRRRHGEEDEESLNFDNIPFPGERTPTDDSSTAEGTIKIEPGVPGGKIGSDGGESESGKSGSGSKSSSKQSMLSSKPIAQITGYVIPVVPFIFSTLVGQAYVHILLRLPLLYFSRVARIFEEADLSVGDLKQMALEAGSKDRGKTSSAYELELAEGTPQYERLKTTWGDFIDSVMREWKTFNIISVLLLSAILTILQIQAAAVDPITRYTAVSSLLCALISLLYGCTYIIRFGNMRKTYKAFEWALEAKKSQKLWWNVWVMLAMPAIWLTWSIILYIACIMSFVWRTSPQDDGSNPISLSPKALLIIRVLLSSLLGIGILYGMLILNTFRRYGLVMDRTWQRRIDDWVDRMDS